MTEEIIDEVVGDDHIDDVIGVDESGQHQKQVRPAVKELYAILLDTKGAKGTDRSFIGEVTEINEVDKIVIIQNTSDKEDTYTFLLDGDHIVMKAKDKYTILDIERVIQFDLDILTKDKEQIQKQLTSDLVGDLDTTLLTNAI